MQALAPGGGGVDGLFWPVVDAECDGAGIGAAGDHQPDTGAFEAELELRAWRGGDQRGDVDVAGTGSLAIGRLPLRIERETVDDAGPVSMSPKRPRS